MQRRLEFRILGPLEVRADGQPLALGGPRQRALLAFLLLEANRVVSRDRLIDELVGEQPGEAAEHALSVQVSRLRKALDPRDEGRRRLVTRAPGYLLRVEPGELDLHRFEELAVEGREALETRDFLRAAAKLREAESLWRGRPLADLELEPFGRLEVERLEELRLAAIEDRIEAELALGRHSVVIPELHSLVARYPLRERLRGQLMLALYRSGRQAEALEVYRSGRSLLVEELALDPTPRLKELEQAILRQDVRLDPLPDVQTAIALTPPAGEPVPTPDVGLEPEEQLSQPEQPGLAHNGQPPRRRGMRQVFARVRRRRSVALALAVAAVGVSVGVGIALGTSGAGASRRLSNADQVVGLNLTSGSMARGAALSDGPAAIAADRTSLWLAQPDTGMVVRVDRASEQVVDRIAVGGSPGALAIGGGSLWVASVPGDEVIRIDPTTETVTQRVGLGRAQATALAFGLGRLWVADATDEALLELDPTTGELQRTIDLDLHPTALTFGAGAVWVADRDAGVVAELDSRSGKDIATSRVGNGPTALAVGGGAVWTANSLDATVSKIDPQTGKIAATISVGSYPIALAVSGDSVVVANEYSESISRIDSHTNAVVETARVGGGPTALVSAGGRIWIGTRAIGAHRGGTLILLHTRPISIDPALQIDLAPAQSDGLTRDGLVTTNHVGGPQGLQIVPDLAVAVPTPTDGGTTYTFRLRAGIRYSNGQPVRAEDFRREIARLFRLDSPGAQSFAAIVGASACSRARCDLARGIVTDDAARTVTFHVRAPDPSFLFNLTDGGLATAVPRRTPFHDTGFTPIPGTGPYMIASASRHEIRYVRNPYFREWSHAAQPDGNPNEIVMRFGLSPAQEVRAVERGRADWTADGVPAPLLTEVTTRFPAQAHSFAGPQTDFLQINTVVPPMNDVRVRQALNFAIDRAVIVRIYGGPEAATPTCQVLPPGVLGYRRYCPYTRARSTTGTWRGPDFARAERLIAASGTRGDPITVWDSSDAPFVPRAVAPYIVRVLGRLGYRAHLRLVPSSWFASAPQRVFRDKIQMTLPSWSDTTPYNFFATWFACSAAFNHHWFCDPRIARLARRAHALEAVNAHAASALWARADHELVDEAAWVPLVNPHTIDFVSKRVGNYQFTSNAGILADQLWLR